MRELITFAGTFFYIVIFARVILSWFPAQRSNPVVQLVYLVTEPILAPLRRVLPNFGMLDLSPMIAMILILVIQSVLLSVVG
ncbi:MAG: YggT family protein [Chloroflexi bacterium]|nr:YggT family protein [Chloroflexota bacterium]